MFEGIILYDWTIFFKEVAQKIAATSDLVEREGLLRQSAEACFPADTPILRYNRIDPFSFIYTMAWFNTVNRRQQIFTQIKTAFGLTADVPTDWFFPTPPPNANVLFHTGPEYVDKQGNIKDSDEIWNLLVQATVGPTLNGDDFATVLNLKSVGVAKLTQTLSLLNAEDFLSLANDFPKFPLPPNPDIKAVTQQGYARYDTFLNAVRARFPGCKMYEVNLLGLLLGKGRWFGISNRFWQVSSYTDGQKEGDDFDSFVRLNAIWTGGSGDHKTHGPYPLPEVQNGDIILVRRGTKQFGGIGIAFHNGHASGFDNDGVIKILWLVKNKRKSEQAVVDWNGFNYSDDRTKRYFKNVYPETFEFLDAVLPAKNGADNINQSLLMEGTPNIILFGPPGTGKTFHSISYAVAIHKGLDPEKFINDNVGEVARKQVKAEFDALMQEGYIQFCTFHQSLGYEDFIEGIKPLPPDEDDEVDNKVGLSYDVTDGMFKRLCTEAAYAFVEADQATEAGQVLEFSDAYDHLASKALEARDAGEPLRIRTRTDADIIIEDVSRHGNLRVRHDEGGRTYGVSKARLSRIAQAFPDLDAVENIHDQFRGVIGGSNATAYYAVLREIREMRSEDDLVPAERKRSYEEKSAAVKELTQAVFEKGSDKRYVLIIDEINRGNVSSIFGELITLLEDDKRLGKPEALRAKLPYSGEDFGVPPNLYVVGTMNTADRSIEALDTALRRRFAFVHKGPQHEYLSDNCEGVNLKLLLEKLNRRLTILVDADHTIGHAWLWNLTTLEALQSKFKTKILPLLQEYFYNDYEKLGRVLGDAFFEKESTAQDELADFTLTENEHEDYTGAVILKLKDPLKLTVKDFQSIYTKPSTNAAPAAN